MRLRQAKKSLRRTGAGILRGCLGGGHIETRAAWLSARSWSCRRRSLEPYEVFLNGVPQRPGNDFRVEGRTLVFERPLAKEGRLGFWRWLSLFLGIAGTYRQNDSVDVVYSSAGRRVVATLAIESSATRSPS